MKIYVNDLKVALSCRAMEDSRPVLTGLSIHPEDESHAMAADGFRMAIVPVRDAKPFIGKTLDGEALALAVKFLPRGTTEIEIKPDLADKQAGRISIANISVSVPFVKGTIPAYKHIRAMCNGNPGQLLEPTAINPGWLAAIGRVFKGYTHLTMVPGSTSKDPVMWRARNENGEAVEIVIMPMFVPEP